MIYHVTVQNLNIYNPSW